MKWIDHQADYVEEHEAKEKIFEEAILISECQMLDNGEGAFDNYKQNSNFILRQQLKSLQEAVHNYQIIRMRNEEFRREDYKMREVMLA